MMILVTSDNFVQMFVGWEGVGLCSYLLINFWFTRIQANKAAIKAMVVNRIGDFGLALGIFTIFVKFKAVDYATVFSMVPFFCEDTIIFLNKEVNLISLIGILLFIGAMGKSAQLGLHTWLPDAMEGPTPVSALIHAATMVTAGVFLIARCSPLYEYAPSVLNIITIIGASTAFFAATVGLVQNDLKRVIAYSTCSQLGYMIFACGLSNYSVGVFHLMNHAFFKALLFLGAGSVIHAVSDEQDMRKMGALKNLVPFTYSLMVIGSLALIGFPFLTGFYSKDVILEVSYGKYSSYGHFSYLLGSCGAFLTAFYSTRLLHLTFLSKPNGYKSVICSAYDSSYRIIISLVILSIPSMFIGYLTKDMIIGFGTDFWGNSIYVAPENMNLIDAEFIKHQFKILPVILSLSGFTLSFILYSFFNDILFNIKLSYFGKKIYNFLNKKWFFDKVYNEYIVQTLFRFSYYRSYKLIDRGIIEILGPMGLSSLVSKKARIFYNLQTGSIYHYSFTMLLSLTLLIGVRLFWINFNLVVDYKIFSILFISLLVYMHKK
jgi:NADH-ubiquinone oxidoreductase chain 5